MQVRLTLTIHEFQQVPALMRFRGSVVRKCKNGLGEFSEYDEFWVALNYTEPPGGSDEVRYERRPDRGSVIVSS